MQNVLACTYYCFAYDLIYRPMSHVINALTTKLISNEVHGRTIFFYYGQRTYSWALACPTTCRYLYAK